MRQIHYVSCSARTGDGEHLTRILEQSRHNNALDGVTGLLWSDGYHFMQIIEGPEDSIDLTFSRIINDDRHHHVSIIHDDFVEFREFSDWTMAHRRIGEPIELYDAKMRRLLSKTSERVKTHFLNLMTQVLVPNC